MLELEQSPVSKNLFAAAVLNKKEQKYQCAEKCLPTSLSSSSFLRKLFSSFAMNWMNRVALLACLMLLLTVTTAISETRANKSILHHVTKQPADLQTNETKLFSNLQYQKFSLSDAKRTTVGYLFPRRL